MNDNCEPASDFLKAVANGEVLLTGSAFADANLGRLIDMTRDDDRSNRDWATLLISQLAPNTSQVYEALMRAAHDEDEYVRGEAILGIAQRDASLALPLIKMALRQESVCLQIFEAAAIVAHPSLADDLRPFAEGEEFIDQLAHLALVACEATA